MTILLLTGVSCTSIRPEYRGNETSIKNFPFMISISQKEARHFRHSCGGTLVTPYWVLTAGHCTFDGIKMKQYPLANLLLTAGVSSIEEKIEIPQTREILKIETKNYRFQPNGPNIAVLENDVALLKVDRPFILNDRVQLVKLVSPAEMHHKKPWEYFKNSKCKVLGWGKKKTIGKFSEKLRVAHLPIIDKQECEKWNITFLNLENSSFCTQEKGHSACHGDSGGPLICKKMQVGICSTASDCKATERPGTWTRVDTYFHWIEIIVERTLNNKKPVLITESFTTMNGLPSAILLAVAMSFQFL